MRLEWILFLALGKCAWLSKEDRPCDPTRGNIHRFTGFKISKELLIQGIFPPKLLRHIIFTNCIDGRVNFQKRLFIRRDMDEMWKSSFCASRHELFAGSKNGTSPIVPELSIVSTKTGRKVFDKVFRFLDGRFREQGGTKHMSTLVTSQQIRQQRHYDLPVCYKMARRKVFAKQNLSYYMPLTFVGGLFSCCGGPSDLGLAGEFLNVCNSTSVYPEMPLVAEDAASQWIEVKLLQLSGPSLKQIIPLFSSARPRNFPYPFANIAGLASESWAKNIDVNENYQYSAQDVSTISESLAATADLVHKIVYPISLEFLMSAAQVGLDPNSSGTSVGNKLGLVNELATALSPDDLMGFALVPRLLSNGQTKNSLKLLMRLQNFWNVSRHS